MLPEEIVHPLGFQGNCVSFNCFYDIAFTTCFLQSKNQPHRRGEYNVYSTFQSHEPEFDYLKSLEIEEKINKIRWLPQQNAAYFLLSTNGKPDKFLFELLRYF